MLPRQLKYDSKVNSCASKCTRVNIIGQNGSSYNLGDTLILNIPTSHNRVLCCPESYLKFNLNITNGSGAAASFRMDSGGAHQLIDRIRIWHGSNLLQDISSYGLLAKIFFDLQVSSDASYGKHSMLSGQRSDLWCTPCNNVAANANIETTIACFNNGMHGLQINSGMDLGDQIANNATTTAAGNVQPTFCLNLISLIGTLCSNNYLPLFAMTGSPLRVEVSFIDQLNKGICCAPTGTGATMQITNCEYVANFIELSDEAMSIVSSSLGGQPLQFVFPSYSNYQYNSIPTSGGQVNIPVAAKYSSLKSLITTQRDQYATDTFFPGSSVTSNISNYYYRIGPQIIPAKAPATLTEMFSECLKAVGSMSDLNLAPSIDSLSFMLRNSQAVALETSTLGKTNSGSFYIGLDLEQYSNSSKQECFTGMNTNVDDVFLVIQYLTDITDHAVMPTTKATGSNIRYDTFAMFDALLVCENNTAFVRT